MIGKLHTEGGGKVLVKPEHFIMHHLVRQVCVLKPKLTATFRRMLKMDFIASFSTIICEKLVDNLNGLLSGS